LKKRRLGLLKKDATKTKNTNRSILGDLILMLVFASFIHSKGLKK